MSTGPAARPGPVDVHAPKRETFDLGARTNTDPKGVVRPVEEFRVTASGLYMSRAADHPDFDHVESWLLPSLDLRVTDFHFVPGREREQDFYVDVMTIDPGPDARVWHTVDLYLDVICRAGAFTEVLDLDEFAAATARGLVDEPTAERALAASFRAVAGLERHGHDLLAWLAAEGLDTRWRRR